MRKSNKIKCNYCEGSKFKRRKNHPFGRKSKGRATLICKRCGEIYGS